MTSHFNVQASPALHTFDSATCSRSQFSQVHTYSASSRRSPIYILVLTLSIWSHFTNHLECYFWLDPCRVAYAHDDWRTAKIVARMTSHLNASAVNIPNLPIFEGDIMLGIRCSKYCHLYTVEICYLKTLNYRAVLKLIRSNSIH
jgi:hypothetical protein